MPYNSPMKEILGSFCLFTFLLAGASAQPQSAPVKRVAPKATAAVSGNALFRQYCASCHGTDGKGAGPAAASMKTPPADLTRLSSNNSGKFPDDRVLRILDGAEPVAAHGSPDMPVWGAVIGNMSSNLAMKQTRVHSLLNYIEEMQAK